MNLRVRMVQVGVDMVNAEPAKASTPQNGVCQRRRQQGPRQQAVSTPPTRASLAKRASSERSHFLRFL